MMITKHAQKRLRSRFNLKVNADETGLIIAGIYGRSHFQKYSGNYTIRCYKSEIDNAILVINTKTKTIITMYPIIK